MNPTILFFIMFGTFALLTYPLISVADTELSYEQQVDFVTAIKEIEGHVLAARENILSGNDDLAKIHLTHPIAEIYPKLHVGSKYNSQMDEKLELVLFILKNTDTNMALENFDDQTSEILKVLHESESTLIKKELTTSSIFKLDVLHNLLELSKYEYELWDGSTNSSLKLVELQDSYAFVVSSENILNTIDDLNQNKKNSLLLQLQEIKFDVLNEQSLDVVQIQFDKIIKDINNLEDMYFESSGEILPNYDLESNSIQKNPEDDVLLDDSLIPSWVKLNSDWCAHGLISDDEFISAMGYLIEQDIIVVSLVSPLNTVPSDDGIPTWIRNNAEWWTDGFISDEEFIIGLEYLIEHGILRV